MSGLSHTPGKRARGYTLRGFESRLLRQMASPVSLVFTGLFGFWGYRGGRVRKGRVFSDEPVAHHPPLPTPASPIGSD